MAADRKRIIELVRESGMGDDWIEIFMSKLEAEFPELAEEVRKQAKEKLNETTNTTEAA